MIDKLKENVVLKQIAAKYGKSLGQIVLRWHYQHGIVPVFRTTNPKRFKENVDIFDFEINKEDMNAIFSLDEDFKFIPESLHCFAY
jgi:diketogulonate reductase-like aldo/keto reductase